MPNVLTTPARSLLRLTLTITLFFLGCLLPVIGVFFLAILPLVLFVLSMVNEPGKVMTALIFSAGTILIGLTMFASAWPVFALVVMAAAGVIAASLARNHYAIDVVIALPCLFVLGMIVFFLVYGGIRASVSPWELTTQYIRESVELNIRLYSRLPLSPEDLAAIQSGKDGIISLFTKIFPGLCFIAVTATMWLNILIGRYLLKSSSLLVKSLESWSEWKAPYWMVWVFIAGGIASFLPFERLSFPGINLFLAASFIYFLHGLAIVGFFFQSKNITVFFRFIAYFLIAIQQILMLAIALIGFLDIWIDFRKYLRHSDSNI